MAVAIDTTEGGVRTAPDAPSIPAAVVGEAVFGTAQGLRIVGSGVLHAHAVEPGLLEFDLSPPVIGVDLPPGEPLSFCFGAAAAGHGTVVVIGVVMPCRDRMGRRGFAGAARAVVGPFDAVDWTEVASGLVPLLEPLSVTIADSGGQLAALPPRGEAWAGDGAEALRPRVVEDAILRLPRDADWLDQMATVVLTHARSPGLRVLAVPAEPGTDEDAVVAVGAMHEEMSEIARRAEMDRQRREGEAILETQEVARASHELIMELVERVGRLEEAREPMDYDPSYPAPSHSAFGSYGADAPVEWWRGSTVIVATVVAMLAMLMIALGLMWFVSAGGSEPASSGSEASASADG